MTTITWVTRGRPCTTIRGPTTHAHPEVSPLVVLRTVAIVLDLFKLMGLRAMTDTSAGLRYYGQCAKTSQPGTNKYIPPRIKRNSIQVLYHGIRSQCSLNTTATLIKSPGPPTARTLCCSFLRRNP